MTVKEEYEYLASLGIDWERFWDEMERLRREMENKKWGEPCD